MRSLLFCAGTFALCACVSQPPLPPPQAAAPLSPQQEREALGKTIAKELGEHYVKDLGTEAEAEAKLKGRNCTKTQKGDTFWFWCPDVPSAGASASASASATATASAGASATATAKAEAPSATKKLPHPVSKAQPGSSPQERAKLDAAQWAKHMKCPTFPADPQVDIRVSCDFSATPTGGPVPKAPGPSQGQATNPEAQKTAAADSKPEGAKEAPMAGF